MFRIRSLHAPLVDKRWDMETVSSRSVECEDEASAAEAFFAIARCADTISAGCEEIGADGGIVVVTLSFKRQP